MSFLADPLICWISFSINWQYSLSGSVSTVRVSLVFDKTGTLTEGKFGVSSVKIFDSGYDEKNIIKIAASLEVNSEHSIAKGILGRAKELRLDAVKSEAFEVIKGEGVKGRVNGKETLLVSKSYLDKNNIEFPEEFIKKVREKK